jgi:hypothetical protein
VIGNHEAVQRVEQQGQDDEEQLHRPQHRFRKDDIEEVDHRVEVFGVDGCHRVQKQVLYEIVADGEDARERVQLVEEVVIPLELLSPADRSGRLNAHSDMPPTGIIPDSSRE